MTSWVFVGDDPSSADLHGANDALTNGLIVAYPTDTVYGLAVDPRCGEAVEKLCLVKGRAVGMGLPLISSNLLQLESCLGGLSPLGRKLANIFWPGPLTLVFEPEILLAPAVHAEDGSLAVRVPNCEIARRLSQQYGYPVTATSANFAGMKPGSTGRAVQAIFGSTVAVVLEQREALTGSASTIVDVRGTTPGLLREGAIPWDRVLQSVR